MGRSFIRMIFVLLGAFVIQHAGAAEGEWVLLQTTAIKRCAEAQTLARPGVAVRTKAIRLVAQNAPIRIDRIVVAYGNGQVDYDGRKLLLKRGQGSRPLAERDEFLLVDSVTVNCRTGHKPDSDVILEIWGLAPADTQISKSSQGRTRGMAKRQTDADTRYVTKPVYYSTTRQREADFLKNGVPLASFSGEQGSEMLFGRALVTVPTDRPLNSIPRPDIDFIIGRFTYRAEDPNRDFTIKAVDVLPKREFVQALADQIREAQHFRDQVLVFIHGYNVSFDDSIFRAAQISSDIGYDGPSVVFSWPSRGGTWDYVHDVETAKLARDDLRDLLTTIAVETGAKSVNVIAHSMGNDPLLEMLKE